MCIFSSNLNLLMEGWKYGSRELLKATFCHPKKESFKNLGFFVTKKAIGKQTGSAQNFLHPPTQVPRGAYIPYFKINAPFFASQSFSKNVFISGQDQQNGKQTYCWLPAHSFRINFKDMHVSPEYFLNFSPNLYIPKWFQKHFNFVVLRLMENTFVIKKTWICSFLLMPQVKSSPGFYHRQKFIYPQQTGEGLWSWKNDQN